MIDRLLQVHYPMQYAIDPEKVHVSISKCQGSVELSDVKACTDCLSLRPQRMQCNRVNLRINTSSSPIDVVDFENYMNQFDHTRAEIRDRCDYILVDGTSNHSKIAFCDLTCSEAKYVNPNQGKYPLGKRAKAANQMRKSLESLLQEPSLAHYILTFPEKVCLFGWRDYDVPDITPQRGNSVRNMLAFMNTPSAKSETLSMNGLIIGHHFRFVQTKYPTIYQW